LKFLKILLIAILIFMATVGGAALKAVELLSYKDYKDPPRDIDSGDVVIPLALPATGGLNVDPLLGTVNVLLVGLDELEGGTRSDAIAVAFFNLDKEVVGVLSIPRDSRVQIPGRGWDKINHAYNYGGVSLLKQTLANLMNVTIQYYVAFNYDSFPRMIDLIGGVDLYVDKPMRYSDFSQKLFINIPQGQQHLDGRKALEYVRFRHDPLGDVGRVQRQQKFISAALEKAKTPSMLLKIPSLVGEVISAINTDLTPIKAGKLVTFTSSLEQGRVQFDMAPGKAAYIGSISYWIVDTVELSRQIARLISGDGVERNSASETTTPDLNGNIVLELVPQIGKIGILNGDGSTGLAKRASQIFQNIGIDVPYTGDARHFGYVSSNIIYPAEQDRQAAEALAKLCGITNKALLRRETSAQMVSIILGHDKETIFKRLEDARPKH
jgi:LCP family protein required for cell wall assembly